MDTIRTLTVADPATFEGTPYEVAERALRQVAAIVQIAEVELARSEVMVRNAELSRNLADTPDDARAGEWDDSVQARAIRSISDELNATFRRLTTLSKAAAYDPSGA